MVVTGLPVAPESQRVDLFQPTFSAPTKITNPLYPVSMVSSVILLGTSADKSLRVEVTLLPQTRMIDWNGVQVETLVSQYLAYKNGRLAEVAIDWYAQADDGAVWYLGEDVFNYANGVVKDTEGTWLTGRDGPAAMIMPVSPKLGDVWRPENVPGKVFEEVTVTAVDVTMPGPRGQVTGAIDTEQLYLDGSTGPKAFAPGYGEFSTGTVVGKDLEAVALAVPVDAVPGPPPAELTTLTGSALAAYDAAVAQDWTAAAASLATITTAWRAYHTGQLPPMLTAQLSEALDALRVAVEAKDGAQAPHSASDLAQAGLDLQLRHRPPAEIDRARLDLHLRRLLIDAAANDPAAVLAEVTTTEWIRDRIAHTLPAATRNRLKAGLRELRMAADRNDLPAAVSIAGQVRASSLS